MSGTPHKLIAKQLGVSVNHVNSSLSRDRAKKLIPNARTERKLGPNDSMRLMRVGPSGELRLDPEHLWAVGLRPNDQAIIAVVGKELRVLSLNEGLDRLITP